MTGAPDTVPHVRERVHQALALLGDSAALLAVSGGVDSMVLLDAATAVCPLGRITVATFNHGTGPAAARAAALVARTALRRGVQCVVGHTVERGRTEADWRLARWRFLSQTAITVGARVVTAHTRDDQVETVFMRALRGAGPRGLAGLEAASAVLRPLLATSRSEIVAYAEREQLRFVTDPSNADRRHLRNRVRLDLLPAIAAVRPSFRDELLEIGTTAAGWRARIEALALSFPMVTTHLPETCLFERAALRGLPVESLRVLWPALAARAGVVMDRRGTDRLAAFTIKGETGQTIQLAGNIEVRIAREAFVFQKRDAPGG